MRGTSIVCAGLIAGLMSGVSLSHAGDQDDDKATDSRWYGGPLIMLDTVSMGLALSTGGVGAIALPFTGPAVHLANDRPSHALGSFGLRLGLPLGLVAIATHTACQSKESREHGGGCLESQAKAALAGFGLALVADWTVMSIDSRSRPKPSPAVAPTVTMADNSVGLGLAGSF